MTYFSECLQLKHEIMGNLKSSFLPDLWVKCMHNGDICLGRTYLQESEYKKIKSLQLVCLVTENGLSKQVPFAEITNIAVLKIFTAFEFEKENSIKMTCSGQKTKPFGLVRTLAHQQLKTKMS
jgi:hypothetical protein